jgi:signal transduction histidine kinase
MMQSMSDIVWSINPAYDSLHDMMIRLKQYMSEVLESQNIEVIYSAHTDLKSVKIDLLHRKELYLALKEIINNIARHAQCEVVRFDISREKNMILFRIQDDGRGMDSKTVVMGNGLRNIESRIKEMNGTMMRQSATGSGMQYEIRISG